MIDQPALSHRLCAEAFGTFCLVFAGTGAVIVDDVTRGGVTHVGVALTFGDESGSLIGSCGRGDAARPRVDLCRRSDRRGVGERAAVPPHSFVAVPWLGRHRGMLVKTVLFVCVENSNRSQMAEAFARMHGGHRVEAASAGSRPSGRVNPKAIEAMKEMGYDLTAHSSKGLEEFNGKAVDVAVTMGCGDECPLVLATRREDWQIPDPREMSPEEFRGVRDLIEEKVRALLVSLGGSS